MPELTLFPRIIQVKHIEDHWLAITFADGKKVKLNFYEKVVGRGGVFLPLEDVAYFKLVRVDQEAGTLVWPNDVDLDPDVLYSEATGQPLPEYQIATAI